MTDHLPLWVDRPLASAPDDDFSPWLEPYPVETDAPRGAVLICPGGGYTKRAPHEAEPVARRFNQAGIHAFVLQYRVAPHRHPAPLLDAARALRLIRARAAEWRIDPACIAVLGFSAGGHLAASLGVHFDLDELETGDELDRVSARPDALILCYPVISAGRFGHQGSFRNLLGPEAPETRWTQMSLERHVGPGTPPTFLWHTYADGGVPVENSLLFAKALRSAGTPFELHIYPEGKHGLGLAPDHPHVATWMPLCIQWLEGQGWIQGKGT